jgi:hypothetical protein
MRFPWISLLALQAGILAAPTPLPPPTPDPLVRGETVWLQASERLALVDLLVPIDPDGYILNRLPILEVPQPGDLAKAIEAKTRQPRQIPASWFHLAVGLTLWGQYDKAVSTLARHRAEPEERQSLRVFEAWLLEQNGQVDEARSLFRSLAESAEERRPILRQLIAMELRQHRFQAALDVLGEARVLQTESFSPTLEYLAGLAAFAVGDDLNAWKTWILLARRPPSEQIPQTFLGLAALSLRRLDPDAALGWFVQGLAALPPERRQLWMDTALARRLSEHRGYAEGVFPLLSPTDGDQATRPARTEFHEAYVRHLEETAKADVRIRLRIHEPYTEFRTLDLFDILPEAPPLPTALP